MQTHDLHNFSGFGREGQTALGRYGHGRILVLGRDAAHTTRVAGARGGQRRFIAAQGEVARRRTVIAQYAIIQNVADQTVFRELAQQAAHVLLNAAARNAAELLARVLVHLAGADVKASVSIAHRAVGEEGQQGRVRFALIGGVRRKGVRGRGKGGHGQLIQHLDCAAFRIQPHGPAARQKKELAFIRQGHQLIRPGQTPLAAPAADHQQIRIVIDVAALVGHDQMRFKTRGCHKSSLPKPRRTYISGKARRGRALPVWPTRTALL